MYRYGTIISKIIGLYYNFIEQQPGPICYRTVYCSEMDRCGVREIKGQKREKLHFVIPTRRTVFIVHYRTYAHPEFLFGVGVGADSEAICIYIYILRLSLNTVL